MTTAYSDEHRLLLESAARFLEDQVPLGKLRALRDRGNPEGYDTALWQAVAELGWPAIVVPEHLDGAGLEYRALGGVLEHCGRHLAPLPLHSTSCVFATLLLRGGSPAQQEQWLRPLAQGQLIGTLAIQEQVRFTDRAPTVEAVPSGDGFILTGVKTFVQDVPGAECCVLSATLADPSPSVGTLLLLILPLSTSGVRIEPMLQVDARQGARLVLENCFVPAANVLNSGSSAQQVLRESLAIANIGLASELLGIALEAFERTVGYLQERRQFGVPIGSFQALQHRAAEMYVDLTLARAVVDAAWHAVDTHAEDLPRQAAAAKAKLCEVAERVTAEAIQMHGGIGMTDEFDIGFFIKRARVAQQTFGDYHYQLDRFAALGGF